MPGFELIGAEERAAVEDVMADGVLFAHGFDEQRRGRFRVRELERAVGDRLGVECVQAVSSGSAALWCAMGALGIGEGDEVVTQAFTFVATVEAILMRGAIPVIVDVDESLNMDPEALESAITPQTALIMPVHMAGVAARMQEIGAIAARHDIPVLEDAAQALGASYGGLPVGAIGRAGVISLDFGKIITCGEGGLVLTSDEEVYRRARALHDHGHDYDSDLPRGRDTRRGWGFNFRMTELQAAVALAQLAKLDRIIETQRETKEALKAALAAADLPVAFRDLPDSAGDNGDTLFFFTEDADSAGRVARALTEAAIGTKNVPDALDWHFAATWDHMLGQFYDRPLDEVFRSSAEILHRTVAVPISVKSDEEWVASVVEVVGACFDRNPVR